MNILAYKLSNANIYINGVDLLGRAEEIDFPQIKHKMVEHKGLGMAAGAEFWAGIEKMECKITWSSISSDIAGPVFNGIIPAAVMIRGYQQQFAAGGLLAEFPVVAQLNGVFKETPKVSVKHQESQPAESNMSVYYYSLAIGGIPQVIVDVMANIYMVQGVDLLANFKQIIGG